MSCEHDTCGLGGTSRIDLFRHLAVDRLSNHINENIFSSIADGYYNEFICFCDQVEAEKDNIDTVSCFIEDGVLKFEIEYKKKN